MRILVLNYEFPPVGGGASTASYHLARELARRDYQVDVLAGGTSSQPDFEVVDGISVYRVPSFRQSVHKAGLLTAITYLINARNRLAGLLREREYDLGLFYFALPTGLLAFRWRKMTPAPYIISLRGSDVPDYDADARLLNSIHRILRPITRRILRQASSVVANSDFLRRLAEASFCDQKIITITNGICDDEFFPKASVDRAKGNPVAVCVARLVPRKAVDEVIAALAICPSTDLQVVIAGEGPCEESLKAQVKKLGIESRVRFAGVVKGRRLVDLYQGADFLIHPTQVESFSMTLLEAMACGLPVVATDVGGNPELVEHEINGLLIPPGDTAALAHAITRLAESARFRAKLARANREKIVDFFTWRGIATQYEEQCLKKLEASLARGEPVARNP